MALHDLTPQLRTRLSRMERAVGWFVIIAAAVLAFGFGYYLYNTAQRKGWFRTKAPYFTFVDRATGLRVGDPVQLMGFDVGRITMIESQPPYDPYNVYVEFDLLSPYYGYMWTEGSRARVTTADLLGKRVIEVTKGTNGYPTYVFHPLKEVTLQEARELPDFDQWVYGQAVLAPDGTNLVAAPLQPLTNLGAVAAAGYNRIVVLDKSEERKQMTGIWNDQHGRYAPFVRGKSKYWLLSDESPAVTDRIEQLISQIEDSLPGVLALTNQISSVLSNASTLTENLSDVAVAVQPAVSNLAAATAQLDQPGALGEWLLPTNLNARLDETLGTASATMNTANTNLAILAAELTKSLENLASITSNLNSQVEANTNIISSLSETIVNANNFVQGLKNHWLLRSAFREPRERPVAPPETLRSPKDRQ
jgi:hypothetical protein